MLNSLTLVCHSRGILSIAWCPQDPDLLMSCAKVKYNVHCMHSVVLSLQVMCNLHIKGSGGFPFEYCNAVIDTRMILTTIIIVANIITAITL